MKIEKLKVGLGIIWHEWMTSTTSRWPSFVVKSYWKMLYIYIYIYIHTQSKHIFFIGQTWFLFFIKKYTRVYIWYIQQKEEEKKVYILYNKHSFTNSSANGLSPKPIPSFFWRALEVQSTIFQCLAPFRQSICTKYLKYP